MQQQNTKNSQIFRNQLIKFRGSRSQKEFAEALGFKSQQAYARYEAGNIPKHNILQQIAQRIGCEIQDLLKEPSGAAPKTEMAILPSPLKDTPIDFSRVREFDGEIGEKCEMLSGLVKNLRECDNASRRYVFLGVKDCVAEIQELLEQRDNEAHRVRALQYQKEHSGKTQQMIAQELKEKPL